MPTTPADTGSPDRLTARRAVWIVLGLLLLGLVLRGARMTESLWYDEIAAWRDYGARGPVAIATMYHDPANHVAQSILSWCSVTTLGRWLGPEISLRLPALVCSLLAIAVMTRLGRAAGDRRLGLVAAALMAVAPVAVLEGAEARGYAMMILASAAASWRLLVLLDDGRWRPSVEYVVIVAIGVWAHSMTVFVAVGHALCLGVWVLRATDGHDRRRCLAGLATIAGAALLTLLLYAPIIGDVVQTRERFAGPGAGGPPLVGPEGWHMLLQLGGAWSTWAAAPGLLLAALGLVATRGPGPARRVVALTLAGLPAMVAAVVISGSWTYARFALFALPGALLCIALGIECLERRARGAGFAALLVFAVLSAADLVVRPPKQPLRDAAGWLAAHRTDDRPILVVGLRHEVLDVYAGDLPLRHSLLHGQDLAAQLATLRPSRVVMLYPDSVPADRHELLRAQGFREVKRLPGWVDWGKGEVVILGRD